MFRHSLFAVGSLALLTACGGGGGSAPGSVTPTSSTSTLSIAMVDAPFAQSGVTVTAVNLGITKVEAIGAGQPVVIASFATPNVVNILNYTAQTSPLTFPTGTIAAGSYSQLRFVLDSATTTIGYTDASGVAHTATLSVPSATAGGFGSATSTDSGDGQGTAGVKVNVSLAAAAGSSYGFLLDFNAAQSIVSANGNYLMKPVIVATSVATAGSIAGAVKNAAGLPVAMAEVDAVQNGTTINSSVTAADGTFTINAVPAGSYTLVVKNTYATQAGAQVTATGFDANLGATVTIATAVTVTAGQTAAAGTLGD